MLTVYARRDNGYMAEWSRWKPRKVFCTDQPDHSDASEIEHVVKYRHGQFGTASAISEVVCGELLEAGGLNVLQRRLVRVSPEFAASYISSDVDYAVVAGDHFGTVLRKDVENGPPTRFETLADPQEILDLWVFDTWLCNIDRDIEGNTLMSQRKTGVFHLIASDQSDCFNGAGVFGGKDDWREAFRRKGMASVAKQTLLDRTMLECGLTCIDTSLKKLTRALLHLSAAIGEVPVYWWREAKIDPKHVEHALAERSARVPDILGAMRRGGLAGLLAGGYHVL